MMGSTLLVASLFVCASAEHGTDAPKVITAQGPIIGSYQDYGIERFAGIPFALPPLGERRSITVCRNFHTFVQAGQEILAQI